MLIPTGIPEEAKASTYKLVKSGFLNYSTSKSFPHGRSVMIFSANVTNWLRIVDYYLFTIATNPSNSALTFKGSK